MAKHIRKISHIDLIEKHYIFCEGKTTEINYFKNIKHLINKNAINRNTLNIMILHENANCDDLIKKAKIEIENLDVKNGNIWCIFDKDDFSDDKFNNAVILANDYSNSDLIFHAIWSNQCFELWLLLHFEYYNSPNNRKNYFEKLSKIFIKYTGEKYNKNDVNIYSIVNKYGLQELAIKNAKKLLEGKENAMPSDIIPGTKVYEVIEAINKYL